MEEKEEALYTFPQSQIKKRKFNPNLKRENIKEIITAFGLK